MNKRRVIWNLSTREHLDEIVFEGIGNETFY